MPDSPGLSGQALNKAAEIGLSRQLDEVENLDSNVRVIHKNKCQPCAEMVGRFKGS